MIAARDLLDDLAVIGATIEPAGDRLILRAGAAAIPADLVSRIRQTKAELLTMLATHPVPAVLGTLSRCKAEAQTFECRVAEWLNRNPAPTPAGRCAWCTKFETRSAMVLPFGTEPGTHAWLHAECWPTWHQARRADAIAALKAMGLAPDGLLQSDHDR